MDQIVNSWRDKRAGRIQLNRPKALNSLNLQMIQLVRSALDDFRHNPEVHAIVIEATGGRAFCAGGDVRAIHDHAIAGEVEANRAFFTAEYALNLLIAEYPKPYVALVDGICMGGGIGLSVHGSHRLATERASFAMPETAIALFPDIGATYILPRLPGAIGMYLALTGTRLTGADAVHAGFATHYIQSAVLPILSEAIAQDGISVIADFAEPLGDFSLITHRPLIDKAFSSSSVPDIIAVLEQAMQAKETRQFAEDTLKTLRSVSPLSVHWSFEIIRAGATRTLEECLAAELALVQKVMMHSEFREGVRAVLIDKDRCPKWTPSSLEAIDTSMIREMFE